MTALILSLFICLGIYQGIDAIPIHSRAKTELILSSHPLASNSLSIITKDRHKFHFQDWTQEEIRESYRYLQELVEKGETQEKTPSYMVFGKDDFATPSTFHWDFVPYKKTSSLLLRFWQQCNVLWKITFRGAPPSEKEREEVTNDYLDFYLQYTPKEPRDERGTILSSDPFCQQEVIDKQLVLEGERINVLYSYTPIGFGGEKLHFLFTTKKHIETFREISEAEYVEALCLAKQVVATLQKNRTVQAIYFYHKTGEEAGQTVKHWHMHLVITTTTAQDIYGKLAVLKNMLLGSSPLKNEALEQPVNKYRNELKS